MDFAALEKLIHTDRSAAGVALDQALHTKHGSGDGRGMLALHLLAVEYWQDDQHQSAFHQTHAYVYALEAGDWATVDSLYAALSAEGRI